MKFLGRDLPKAQKDILTVHSDKLMMLSETGSELLGLDWETSEGGDEVLTPMLFLRNQIEIIESIAALVRESLLRPCNILLRSLIETCFYLEYLFERDTERRSLAFIVWQLNKNMNLYKQSDGVSMEFKRAEAIYNKDNMLRGKAFISDKAKYLTDNTTSLLGSKKYQEVNKEYQRVRSDKGQSDWFTLFDGPRNIIELCDRLSATQQYQGFYRTLSGYSHGTSVLNGVLSSAGQNKVGLVQVRNAEDLSTITVLCFTYAQLSFMTYVKARLPMKLEYIRRKFQSDEDFLNSLLKP